MTPRWGASLLPPISILLESPAHDNGSGYRSPKPGVGMCRVPLPSPCDIHQKGLAFEHRERGAEISRSNLFGIFERIIANYLFITLVKFSLGRLMEYHVLSTLG